MEINWKIVAPIALFVGIIVMYFVRVKPIEGLENADAKIKEYLSVAERMNKTTGEFMDTEIKHRNTNDYKELIKQTKEYASKASVVGMMTCIERVFQVGNPMNDPEGEKLMKQTEYMRTIKTYCDNVLSSLNGTNISEGSSEGEPSTIMGF